MLTTLRAIWNLFSPEPPPPVGGDFEHTHWDRQGRAWRDPSEPEDPETGAA